MSWLSKILREKWEKVFTKVGLGCEAERRCIDGLCCFFFSQISVHVYVCLGNKDGKESGLTKSREDITQFHGLVGIRHAQRALGSKIWNQVGSAAIELSWRRRNNLLAEKSISCCLEFGLSRDAAGLACVQMCCIRYNGSSADSSESEDGEQHCEGSE